MTAARFILPCLALASLASAAEPPSSGPSTESRFPKLQLPPEFRPVLFAADPLVEYPSVIALGPKPGSLFVAQDYMTGLGKEITRRSEVRLLEDTDDDGYADRSTVYAGGFNSIQGLEFHFGEVFVMHAPRLTRLRDVDGDGKADERRDLLTGLGYKPEDDPIRLHSANGVVAGHDGWLYLALGDHGCDVLRPEGDRLKLEGGGILRCRRDGSDLHIFSTGLRNIYDVALDEELNVFVRDNENDGGAYKNRVYHSFHGADHGYPYLYYEYPHETMAPLADVGLGSSAGGVCYLETAFPPAYRGNLFFCEWGKSVVTYSRRRAGSSFRPVKEIIFATGGAGDAYPFKTTDIVVDRDGSLLISDWADGQRPKRGRGRIYRIIPAKTAAPAPRMERPVSSDNTQLADLARRLNSKSHHERVKAQHALVAKGAAGLQATEEALAKDELVSLGRLHACWIHARVAKSDGLERLFEMAARDPAQRVRAQAVRAIADLTDPILQQRRLDAGPGDSQVAARLARLGNDASRELKLEVIIALGRLKWNGLPDYLRKSLRKPDAALNHAAMQSLRRCGAWSEVVKLLDAPNTNPVKALARWAVAGQADPIVVRGLIRRLADEKDVRLRRRYADHLTRVHRKPAPWTYWGFRPPPRPINPVDWEQTAFIEDALNEALNHPNPGIHAQTLTQMQLRDIPVRLRTLTRLLALSRNGAIVSSVLESVAKLPPKQTRDALVGVILDADHTTTNRIDALKILTAGLDLKTQPRLVALTRSLEDGPVAAEAVRALGERGTMDTRDLLVAKTKSPRPEVRTAALESLVQLRYSAARPAAHEGLFDKDVGVRIAAAKAAGSLKIVETSQRLTVLLKEDIPELQTQCLTALRQLDCADAVPQALAALNQRGSQVAAMKYLATFGGSKEADAMVDAAVNSRSSEMLVGAAKAIGDWSDARAAASVAIDDVLESALQRLQGESGQLLTWMVVGPAPSLPPKVAAEALAEALFSKNSGKFRAAAPESKLRVRFVTANAVGGLVRAAGEASAGEQHSLAAAEFAAPRAMNVRFTGSGGPGLTISLNRKAVFSTNDKPGAATRSIAFDAALKQGRNVLMAATMAPGAHQFRLSFREIGSSAEREQLLRQALSSRGNAQRGRDVFFNVEKSTCLKCHRLGDQGAYIGPDLTGAGKRFSKTYLIESILEPSRAIAPSYGAMTVDLKDDRVITGRKMEETRTTLTLGDNQGKIHRLRIADIANRQASTLSLMPVGLEKGMTSREFYDLLAFLISQK